MYMIFIIEHRYRFMILSFSLCFFINLRVRSTIHFFYFLQFKNHRGSLGSASRARGGGFSLATLKKIYISYVSLPHSGLKARCLRVRRETSAEYREVTVRKSAGEGVRERKKEKKRQGDLLSRDLRVRDRRVLVLK